MERQEMEQNVVVELDQEQKGDAVNYLKALSGTAGVGQFMAAAIKVVNEDRGVDPKRFWEDLFLDTNVSRGFVPIIREGRAEGWKNECPEDPYSRFDTMASIKYLMDGGKRRVTENPPQYAIESKYFFERFCPDTKWQTFLYPPKPDRNGNGGFVPSEPYYTVLKEARELRNQFSHDNSERLSEITFQELCQRRETLRALTRPLLKTYWDKWDEQRKHLQEMWAKWDQEFDNKFGAVPISLDALGQEIFLSTGALTQEQKKALDDAVYTFFKLDVRDGKVYQEPNFADLVSRLKRAPSIAALQHTAAAATPKEAAEAVARFRLTPAEIAAAQMSLDKPLWTPVGELSGMFLKKAGYLFSLKSSAISHLLNRFTLLVDESIFLSEEGRKLLTEYLAPLLMKQKLRLPVDESVKFGLFRQFRGSVPYTEVELADMDDERSEAMQKERRVLHQSSKAAIKALRFLRERKCLEIQFSPLSSTDSFENIMQIINTYPAQLYLVLTMDQQLANAVTTARGRNAVAAKPTLDDQLLIYRSSRKAYQSILAPQDGSLVVAAQEPAAPAGQEASAEPEHPATAAPLQPAARRLAVRTLPQTDSLVQAVLPDNSRISLRLGRKLAAGGEGTIYVTSDPAGSVAKIYFARQITAERLEKLLQMVGADPGIQGLCWPQALLYNEENEWVGYLMPRASGRELATTVFHPGRNCRSISAQGWSRKSLAQIAANIASAFSAMHTKGILMGDINPRNFLVGADCAVYLVDCDSYQFGSFPCPVGTPLYTPPEVHKRMRASGNVNYSYIRTKENELYSLAVLLFEILMLGKSPYERSGCTDNEDVVQMIVDGLFPYPFQSNDEDAIQRSGLHAPTGPWRLIWSHTTYTVKDSFTTVFTGKKRLTAAEWETVLREYARQIELGHSSDELMPSSFKDLAGRDGAENLTKMVDRVCEICGKPFNIGEDVYRRRQSRGEPDLCNLHWEMRKNFSNRTRLMNCSVCGDSFEANVQEWIDRTQQKRPMFCPRCTRMQVRCSVCGRDFQEHRDKVNAMHAQNRPLLCAECFEKEFPSVTCDDCGNTFRMVRAAVERRRRYGDLLLCRNCRNKRSTAGSNAGREEQV